MRILAVEDGGFKEGVPGKRRGKTLLVGVVVSNFQIEKTVISQIEVDGLDATCRLVEMIEKEKEAPDLIMLGSISYGGFNLMDIVQAYERLKIPIIVANPKKPDERAVEAALLHHFPDWVERFEIIKRIGKPEKLVLGKGEAIYFHAIGIPKAKAKKLIKELIVFGKRPEPLRIARMLAHELSK